MTTRDHAPGKPDPGQIWRFEAASPEEAERCFQPLDLQYLQLQRGQFGAQAHAVMLDDVGVGATRFDTAIRSRGRVISGSLIFNHVRSTAPAMMGHAPLHPACLTVSSLGDDRTIVTRAAVEALTIVVREARWKEVVRSLGAGPDAMVFPGLTAVQCAARALEELERKAWWVLRAAEAYPDCFQRREIRRVAEIGLIWSLMVLLHHPTQQFEQPPHAARRREAVASVETYVRNHLSDSLTLVDLCRISGLKVRALQYAFQEKYGISPMGYLKLKRLDKARRLLSRRDAPHLNVTAAALECGFWHLAQFAQDYRRMFGECPSQTLRAGIGSPRLNTPRPASALGSRSDASGYDECVFSIASGV